MKQFSGLRRGVVWVGLAVLVAACQPANDLVFQPAARAPLARFESGTAVVGDRLYILGGHMGAALDTSVEVYAYELENDRWTRRADLPAAVSHMNAVVESDRYIWIAGGFEGRHPGKAVRQVWRFDTLEDRWDPGPPLPAKRGTGGLALVAGKLHYFGGLGADRWTNHPEHWVHELGSNGGWEPRAPMPDPRGHFATIVVEGKIYALGGHFHHGPPPPGVTGEVADLKLVNRYDPKHNRWETLRPLPSALSHTEPGTFVHDGHILMVGGRNNSPGWITRIKNGFNDSTRGLREIVAYDPQSSRSRLVGLLPMELYAPSAAVLQGRLVVTGGGGDGWRDPSDLTWTASLPSGERPDAGF